MRYKNIVAAMLVLGLGATPARAAFQYPFQSPQTVSMGGVAAANTGDVANLFTNPAGIGGLKSPEAYFTYTQMFAGLAGVPALSRGYSAAAMPTRFGTVGVGVGIFDAAGLLTERTVSVGLSREFHGATFGLAVKNLYHGYKPGSDPLAANDPVFDEGTSRSAFAFDFGVVAPAGPLKLSLAVRNINQPDVGLRSTDRVRREIQAGASIGVGGGEVTGDLSFLNSGSGPQKAVPGVGYERKVMNGRVAFRAGFNAEQLTGGVGVNSGKVSFDYAWVLTRNLAQDNSGTHTIGIRVPFGKGAR